MFQTSSQEFCLQAKTFYSSFYYSSLCLLLALLGLGSDLANCQMYNLVLDTENSPPAAIPTDPKKLVYSVPLNQLTSRPIIVYIQDNTSQMASSLHDSIRAHVTSMDRYQKNSTDLDSWRDSGGKLCQWSNPDEDWPERLNRELYSTVCGSHLSTTTMIVKIFNGRIILDWLMHVHPNRTLPANDRFVRIEIPQLNISKNTNLFKITEPAASLKITKQPPKNITANTRFEIAAEILDRKGAPLVVGLDSVAFVELTVSYNHKMFYQLLGKDMILKYSSVRLGGPLVTTYKATRDLVIRQRASAGKVYFTDVRILDCVYDLKLNLTMFMSKDPFLRIPNCEKCHSDLTYKLNIGNLVKFEIPPISVLKDIPSMIFTNYVNIFPQTFAKLKFTSNFKGTGKMSITRNFPIPGPLIIETQDINGSRIFSGHDSELPLEVKTIPVDVCLSRDFSLLSYEGVATFIGSICDIRNSVFLVFYSKQNPTVTVTSQEIEVDGYVHIAHFDHFEFTGAGRQISPHINSFIRFAATDVNNGVIPGVLRPFNMKLFVITIETKNDIANTILQYRSLRDEAEKRPDLAIRAAILSGDSKISAAIVRELFHQNTTQISLDERDEKFTDFPLFNRVCWNSKQIYHSFFQLCLDSYWTRMIILKTSNAVLSRTLKRYARSRHIYLSEVIIDHEQVNWKATNPDVYNALKHAMEKVKDKEIKIIACFANYTQIPAILNVAKKEGVSPEEGYQWVFVSEYAWGFPFNNTYSCDIIPESSRIFGGTILFTETYNTSFLHTLDWERVLNYYYSVDKSIYLGLTSVYPNTDTSARMALGYDAMWLYAVALTNIASKRLTATTERVTKELRKVTIEGLSGTLKLDENGDREGFQANVRIIDANKPKEPMEKAAPLYKYIVMTNDGKNFEYVYEDYKNTLFTKLPMSPVYNIRKFRSKTGRLSKSDLHFIKYSNELWPPKFIIRFERILPPFTCKYPCGDVVSIENVNLFDRGICYSMNNCKCYPGFFGKYCEKKICKCQHGRCDVPFVCICYDGYTGRECAIPICPGGCKHGICVQPDECNCFQHFWVGRHCDTHLAAILVPLIINLILFIYLGYTFFIFFRSRIKLATALSNLEWLVDWQDVIQLDKGLGTVKSMVFTRSAATASANIYRWKERKWFMKKINCNTIDQYDENVRLEMVELISLHHQNLITYGGACLVNPNVCFLLEPAQKGSLDEVLLNDTIQLDWNFRFSFLKDICRGMNFLHTKSTIGSHGRLKSSNCLLDNRWCIRITDFGAPTMRYGPYLIENSETENSNVMQEALLWTAPELLETASCLNDVRMGTKEGDVYSFGIIVSEIATRDVPFAYERGFLSTCALLDLIVNRDDPVLENELEIWKSLDNDVNIIRPYIHEKYLPEVKAEKIKFRKMLDDIWTNDPLARITFQRIATVLDNLFPTREELMDNLMNLLESYSKNLEQIVIERTDALEAEKTKVENIVSQMLPRKVIEELKNGNKVEPENFECVTVYYSDIVGFTTIAKNIQPMEVVDLLNELYILFDSILAKYDVYKVETIGDAYVVSSGVPILNDNLHAGEIATASLDMMSAIMMRGTPNLGNVKLQLRLGINTGPVVAGVVGLKMPRYTLFGETMQIASVMESSSKPMHIQISESTVQVLQLLGGYWMKYRGNMTVCGKNIDTYWLTGKKDFQKPLPEFVEE